MLQSSIFKCWPSKTQNFEATTLRSSTLGWPHAGWVGSMDTGVWPGTFFDRLLHGTWTVFLEGTGSLTGKAIPGNEGYLLSSISIWKEFPERHGTKRPMETPFPFLKSEIFWILPEFSHCVTWNLSATALHTHWLRTDAPRIPREGDTGSWLHTRRALRRLPGDRGRQAAVMRQLSRQSRKGRAGQPAPRCALPGRESTHSGTATV